MPADYVVIKVTGGDGFVNPYWRSQFDRARAAGRLVGLYHFARDGYTSANAGSEARHFINQVRSVNLTDVLLVLDWEGDNVSDVGYAAAWINDVEGAFGKPVTVYMNKSVATSYNWSGIAPGRKLWLAWYWYDPAPTYGYNPPGGQPTGLGAWGAAWIWQYSQYGRLQGYGGSLDLDVLYGDAGDWKAAANGKPARRWLCGIPGIAI